MKIIHYYTGRQVSDEEFARARAVRLEGHSYHFIDARAWDGLTETADKVVSDKDAILEAYAAQGIGEFDSTPWEPRKPQPKAEPVESKPVQRTVQKRGRPKKTAESVATGGDPVGTADLAGAVKQ